MTPIQILDAWFGREGARMSAEDLHRFYAETYLERNADLDVADTAQKAEKLLAVCHEASVSRPVSILEVGCGSGELLGKMARALGAARPMGAEYSASIAAVARTRTGFEIVATDGQHLPFQDGEIDLVYFADVLEHVLDPTAWLRELGRVGRRVACLVPLEWGLVSNAIYVSRRARGRSTNFEQYGHIWRWRRAQVLRIFRDAGLRFDVEQFIQAPPTFQNANLLGRAFEELRVGTARISGRASAALFGGVTLVGVASPAH